MSRIFHIDTNQEALSLYRDLKEPQLKHYFEPEPGLFIAETRNVAERALTAGYLPLSFLTEERYAEDVAAMLDRFPHVDPATPVYTAPLTELISLTGYNLTRGVLGLLRRKPLPSVEEVCDRARRLVILENVDNPTNVGAIFRSAAALGMDGILLTCDCCDPLYRRALRVSVGNVFSVPWTFMPCADVQVRRYIDEEKGIYRKEDACYNPYWPHKGMQELAKRGFRTAALALAKDAIPIDSPVLAGQDKLAVLLGNEGYGLQEETLSCSDHKVIIPMTRGVDSLNVAAASAVAFWQLRERH